MAYLDQILCDTSMVWKRGCIIRIFNGCEVRIENLVTKVSLVMPTSYPEGWNFQFAPNNYYRFFFLNTLPLTTAFKLKCVLFCQFYTKISTFFCQDLFSSAPTFDVDVGTFSGKWPQKLTSWRPNSILSSYTRVVLHPSCKTTFPSPSRVHRNSGQVHKKTNWAALWQNQQNDCAPSEDFWSDWVDSDQSGHLHSLRCALNG